MAVRYNTDKITIEALCAHFKGHKPTDKVQFEMDVDQYGVLAFRMWVLQTGPIDITSELQLPIKAAKQK